MIKHTFTAALFAAAVFLQPARAQETTNSSKPASTALFEDEVIARGEGFEIKRSELDALATGFKASAAGQGRTVPPEQMRLVERNLLDLLIRLRLANKEASEADKAAGKAEAARRIELIKENAPSPELLETQLRSMGMTVADLQKRLELEVTAEKYLERTQKPSEPFSEAEAREYYENNPDQFEAPERVRAAHVLISTVDRETNQPLSEDRKTARLKLANDILERARDGEDFAKLAKEYSDDPGSKDKGGEYTFPRGQMVPEFEQAAFSLETNQISNVVTTQFGYHIIKVLEKLDAEKKEFKGADTITFLRSPDGSDVTINDILLDQTLREKGEEHMAKLKEQAGVEILDENLKAVEPPQAVSPPVAVPAE